MNEWKEVKLDEIGDVFSGGTPSTTNTELWDGNIAFVTPFDLSRNKTLYIKKTQRYISRKGLEQSSTNLLPANSLILSSRAPIGYIALSDIEFVTNQGCKSLKFFDTQEPLFHYYNLQMYVDEMKRYGVGTTFSEISKGDLSKLKIRIPKNNKDQLHIAKILFTCDTVIEQTQSAIAKYKAIKQGLLHGLFTRGLDGNGKLRPRYQEAPELYKESELGMIPKEWEVNRLEECTNYVDYRGKTPPKSDIGIVLVTAKNIRFGYIDYELSKEYIYEYAFESAMSRGKAFIGDVLITTEAPMGNVAQINKEGIALAQRVIKYQGYKDKLNNDFLKLALMSDLFQKTLLSEATGSTALGIKGSRLHKLKILIPQIEEQREIAKRVKTIDNKIQSEETLLQKYQSIKRGLMGDLLGGKKMMLHDE